MRRKEKEKRKKDNEKQKRHRESMKAQGFKQVLLWDLPYPADVRERMTEAGFWQIPAWEKADRERDRKSGAVKVAAVIRETSIGATDRSPEIKKAVSRAMSEFLHALGGGMDIKLTKETDAVYHDFIELLKPLRDPWGDNE